MSGGRTRFVGLAIGALVLAATAAAVAAWLATGRDAVRSVVARRGDLERTVRRRGTLRPAREVMVTAPFGGFLTSIIASGAPVKQGDLLFVVDGSRFEDGKRWRTYRLARCKADIARTEASGAKDAKAAENEVERCRLRLELETLRHEELRKGPRPEDELSAKTNLQAAANILKARREELDILRSLSALGFVSGEEVRTKELQVKETEVDQERAEIAWKQIQAGPMPSRIEEQALKVKETERYLENARSRLESVKRSSEAAVAQARQQARFQERSVREITEKLNKARTTAPVEGSAMVQLRWGAPWSPGRQVWDGVEVVSLPTLKRMKAVVAVDESRIGMVRAGQDARVRVLAFPAHRVRGRVSKVAELGKDEFEGFLPETRDRTGEAMRKAYDVEIEMEDTELPLSANMTVEVEIVLESVRDGCLIPRVAVRGLGGDSPYVEMPGRFGVQKRPVRVAASTGTRCAIAEGLAEGERVLLPEADVSW